MDISHYFISDTSKNIYEQYRLCNQRHIYFQQNQEAAYVGHVLADGNCLFRALSHVLTGGTEKAHFDIRTKVLKNLNLYLKKFFCRFVCL